MVLTKRQKLWFWITSSYWRTFIYVILAFIPCIAWEWCVAIQRNLKDIYALLKEVPYNKEKYERYKER